jgi:DNA-directed RNA polymerase subunit RPC12/RpoP
MKWREINLDQLPKDGTEFLVRNNRQGGVKSLIYWDKIHKYWKSKGEPVLSLQDTHWMEIPEFMPMCVYDCAKCGKDFQDELYPEGPQNLSDNYDFLCSECKKTIPIKDSELHRKLLHIMRMIRYAYSRYELSAEQHDLDEMNEMQLKIIDIVDALEIRAATSDFCSAEWKNDFDRAKIVIQKIDDATTSDDNLMEKILVINNIIEDYTNENI